MVFTEYHGVVMPGKIFELWESDVSTQSVKTVTIISRTCFTGHVSDSIGRSATESCEALVRFSDHNNNSNVTFTDVLKRLRRPTRIHLERNRLYIMLGIKCNNNNIYDQPGQNVGGSYKYNIVIGSSRLCFRITPFQGHAQGKGRGL